MIKFRTRSEAGRLLARRLKNYEGRPDVLVLGLPRGGVPVAFEVARALRAPLDVLVVRKLGVPGHPELAMGAIAADGVLVLNQDLINRLHINEGAIARVAAEEQEELERLSQMYRGVQPPTEPHARRVILVDDGIATGATMRAAIAALRSQQPAAIIVAAPVASVESIEALAQEADQVVTILTPPDFYAVGVWYEEFPQVTAGEVRAFLQRQQRATSPEQHLPLFHYS
jgi:putative phosphoribosyl transferase